MNKIYLFDHDHRSDIPSNWAKALVALGVNKNNLFNDNEPPASHCAYGKDSIIFCHSNGYEEEWRTLVKTHTIQGNLIFVRSGGGQPPESSDRLYGCFWKPSDFSSDCTNEAVRQFVSSLRVGEIRSELLQPRAVPKTVLAYTIAVYFGIGDEKIEDLRISADKEYKDLYSHILFLLPSKKRFISYPEIGLPDPLTFDLQPLGLVETEGTRFKAMRNLIDALREDL